MKKALESLEPVIYGLIIGIMFCYLLTQNL